MSYSHLIFVYGTLKRDLCRAHFLDGQQFLGEARTLPIYRLFDCGDYPGLRPASDGLSILGELWAVDLACLAILDREECLSAGLYARQAIEMDFPLPESVHESRVEAYFYLPSVNGFADCGDQWIKGRSAEKAIGNE